MGQWVTNIWLSTYYLSNCSSRDRQRIVSASKNLPSGNVGHVGKKPDHRSKTKRFGLRVQGFGVQGLRV